QARRASSFEGMTSKRQRSSRSTGLSLGGAMAKRTAPIIAVRVPQRRRSTIQEKNKTRRFGINDDVSEPIGACSSLNSKFSVVGRSEDGIGCAVAQPESEFSRSDSFHLGMRSLGHNEIKRKTSVGTVTPVQ